MKEGGGGSERGGWGSERGGWKSERLKYLLC